jgi:quercetin dioxygenase-like cupin family protein
MTLQCLEGRVAFTTMGKTLDLSAGQMLHLAAGEAHALQAVQSSSLLLTLVLK